MSRGERLLIAAVVCVLLLYLFWRGGPGAMP